VEQHYVIKSKLCRTAACLRIDQFGFKRICWSQWLQHGLKLLEKLPADAILRRNQLM
jgi:hypothetical protein